MLAEMRRSIPAGIAGLAHQAWINGYHIPWLYSGNPFAHLADLSCKFVPQNHRRLAFCGTFGTLIDMHIGPADSCCLHMDHDFLEAWFLYLSLLVTDIAFSIKYRCFHTFSS